jgi:class 3 adenylate cyclase/tetratricopeptide (TPR) repeat protein
MECPACRQVNPESARFCVNCGAALEAARPPEGERKVVTVLFADVVGSTAMGERLDPEQVLEVMDGAFARFNAAVTEYGGTVARLMGDAILALFGAPVAHEDDAERAVRAGLALQAAAQAYGREVARRHGVAFDVRVGIHTGLAVLAVVGDAAKTEYTAMGDTPNVAARLQSAAAPGTVLVSGETHRLIRNLFDVDARGPLEVKGRSAPVEAHVVRGPTAVPGRVRGLDGLRSPLVGRDREIGLLHAQVDRLQAGRGGFVALFGEAGLGKSRLMAELRERAAAATPAPLWLEGRCVSYSQAVAYYPWREAFRAAIGAAPADPPEVVRERLQAACRRYGLVAGNVAPIEALLGVESADSRRTLAGLAGGDALARAVAQAARDVLGALARAAPTVLVLDDLHWADRASLDLLERVGPLGAGRPLLLVGLLRPDREAPSWPVAARLRAQLGEAASELWLEPLGAEGARELLGGLLEVEDLPESARALILQKAEGNPFFLEEVIRTLLDAGQIVREDDHWRATREIRAVAIPDTLAGVLSARIDRLPEATKRVAQTAAVIGRIFAQPVLGAVCAGAPPPERIEDPEPQLIALTRAELVRRRAHEPDPEYIFKHALTHEAAYESLLLRRRRELHRRTGVALESLYAERADELAPVLAHHYWQAEDWPRAAAYARRAGSQARRLYALDEALRHYERALQALENSPDSPPEQVHDAILEWTWVAHRLHRYAEMRDPLARAEKIAREVGDARRLARALAWQANVHVLTDAPERAIPPLIESHQAASAVGDDRLIVLPQFVMTFALVDRGPRAALAALDRVIAWGEEHDAPAIAVHALATKGMAHARLGEFSLADAQLRRALEGAPRTGSPLKEADVDVIAALAYMDMGDVERGLAHGRRATERALALDAINCICVGYFITGQGNLLLQDVGQALRAFEASSEYARSADLEDLVNRVYAGHAIARLAGGDAGAVGDIEQALANARAIDDRYLVAFLSQTLAELHTRAGDYPRAEDELATALDYYRAAEMRPYLTRALGLLANLRDRQGRSEEATSARRESEELMAALGQRVG